MSKLSDATPILSMNNTDEVLMLRPSGPVYTEIKAVVSVFMAQLLALMGDDTVTWASIDKSLADIADLANRSHTDLTDIGRYSHDEIDDFIVANAPDKVITFAPVESDISVQIQEGTIAFTVPALLNGYLLSAALASVHTLGAGSGSTTIQVRRRRAGADVDMLSTKITISYDEYFASDGIINTTYDDLATGDQIYVDIDELSSTPPTGLSIALTFSSAAGPLLPLASPSSTPSTSPSASSTPSGSATPSSTPSRSPSRTPSTSPSASATPSPSETPSATPSATPSPSETPSATPSATPS
jgi:hypothetical protein